MKFTSSGYKLIAVVAVASLLTACALTNSSLAPSPLVTQLRSASLKVATLHPGSQLKMGQTVYVPIYSHIYFEDQQKILNLAATLSVRNTDFKNSLIIKAVQYYDSDGKLVKQYLKRPVLLEPMATASFIVSRTDMSGGSGANFIVEWVSQEIITEPVVEAVMIGTEAGRGFSFISTGRVIQATHDSQ